MTTQNESLLKKIVMVVSTTAAAFGMTLGLPIKKAAAEPRDRMAPGPMMSHPAASMEIIQPRFVSPTAVNLLNIAHMALSDGKLAEEISRNPEAVAKRFHLSAAEMAVLRHMDRQQFDVARADASRLVAKRMNDARMMQMPPGATDVRLITERMIVGRAILAAVGRSYLEAADANACCPWSKSIEIGVQGDPAAYNRVFANRAG